jgi:hypothetical protein
MLLMIEIALEGGSGRGELLRLTGHQQIGSGRQDRCCCSKLHRKIVKEQNLSSQSLPEYHIHHSEVKPLS